MYPAEIAHVLERANRFEWEGVPDPYREAVRDLSTDVLKGRNFLLVMLIANGHQSKALERLSRAVCEALETRQ